MVVIKLNYDFPWRTSIFFTNMDNIATKLKELMAKKDLIESDIKSYNEVLESVSLNQKSLFSY